MLEPNFYAQEDYLWGFRARQSIAWNVVRPSFILGAVPDVDAARNKVFNVCDSSAFTWRKLWPTLAGWYGVECEIPDTDRECIARGCTRTIHRREGACLPPACIVIDLVKL